MSALAVLVGITVVKTELRETDILNAEVTSESISPLVKNLMDDSPLLEPFMTTTLVINSPGGSVDQMNLLLEAGLKSTRTIVTKVPKFAASAAADIFLMGDVRLMGKDAKVLFHEVRIAVGGFFGIGGYYVTYTDLKSILETGKLGPNSSYAKEEASVVSAVKENIGTTLAELVNIMTELHEDHIAYLMKRLDMTREDVLKHLLIPNKDVILNYKQAKKLGIATGQL